jgi:hypothetical protein
MSSLLLSLYGFLAFFDEENTLVDSSNKALAEA